MRVDAPQDDDADDNAYEVHMLYLDPDYFRMGIGAKSMDFAFDIAKNLGKTVMIVWVLDDNVSSIKFYEKCGFKADGKKMDAQHGKVDGRIRMQKRL